MAATSLASLTHKLRLSVAPRGPRLRRTWMTLRPIKNVLLKLRFLLIWFSSGEFKIRLLRMTGMKIGKHCAINARNFSTEPFLIEIGDHVAISTGTSFVTHDGAAWVLREKFPDIDVFGRITVGNNTFIGTNCLILAGTQIGSNCVIGAGSVVRGIVPDNSVAIGNPAKVIFSTKMLQALLVNSKHKLMTKNLGPREKRQALLRHFGIEP